MIKSPPTIYLAGPDVFRPDAKDIGKLLKEYCANRGVTGLWPLDNDIHYGPQPADRIRAANAIRRANEGQIIICDAIVANISPFRGPHMDPGTAYEIGFGRAVGKPLFAYSTDIRTLIARMHSHEFVDSKRISATDARGYSIEDFGLTENLMIGTLPERVYQTAREAITACATHLIRNRKAMA